MNVNFGAVSKKGMLTIRIISEPKYPARIADAGDAPKRLRRGDFGKECIVKNSSAFIADIGNDEERSGNKHHSGLHEIQ